MSSIAEIREKLGEFAANLIEPEMRVGLGSGGTAECFIRALAVRQSVCASLQVAASSESSARLAKELGMSVQSLEAFDRLDIVVDGSDQISPEGLLIKGRGAALFREKILSYMTQRYLILADWTKFDAPFGQVALPLEICPYAWAYLKKKLTSYGQIVLRRKDDRVVVTDNQNWIVDLQLDPIPQDWRALHCALKAHCGVVETGLFFEKHPDIYIGLPNSRVEAWTPNH